LERLPVTEAAAPVSAPLRWLRHHPFTLLGVVTLGLFLLDEWLMASRGHLPTALLWAAGLLIGPIWLMRYVVAIVGGLLFGFGRHAAFALWYELLMLPVLLVPYFRGDMAIRGLWSEP
jgi:hypothetical protein